MILFKLHGNFQIFASTLYFTKNALGNIFTMPSFEVFCDHFIREQVKLSQLDSLTGSQNHPLVAGTSSRMKEKTQKSHSTESHIDSRTHSSLGPPPQGG